MVESWRMRWLTDLMEGLPSVVFIVLWRQSGDLELAGWAGSAAAFGVLAVLAAIRVRMHPVLIGVNLHILLATPVIVGLFRIGQADIGAVLASHAHGGVLVTVLIAGLVQTILRDDGFSALPGVARRTQIFWSCVFLGVCALGAVWALSRPESTLVPVAVTLTVLFLGRNFLKARSMDHGRTGLAAASMGLLGDGSPASEGAGGDGANAV